MVSATSNNILNQSRTPRHLKKALLQLITVSVNICINSTCGASDEDTLKSDETSKVAINQSRSFWIKTAPVILQEQ